jgi:solute:Na+ symporter, SSS family
MTEITADVLAIAGIYLVALLVIGWWSYRKTLPTPEDFFMAGRAFGPVVLIFAVYATNMTAFYMLGTPGNAYRQGIGTYGYIAFASALVIPAMFYLIGYRAWRVGKRYGYMTPSELLGARYESPAVALVLFVLLVFYTVPYIVTSVIGAGLALESLAKDPVSLGSGGRPAHHDALHCLWRNARHGLDERLSGAGLHRRGAARLRADRQRLGRLYSDHSESVR